MKELYKLRAPIQIDLSVFQKWKMVVNDIQPLFQYSDGKRTSNELGIKVVCVILQDDLELEGYTKNVNRYEKITFKILGENNLNLFKTDEEVKPYNVKKALIYGDYGNELSIECNLMNADQYRRNLAKSHSRG